MLSSESRRAASATKRSRTPPMSRTPPLALVTTRCEPRCELTPPTDFHDTAESAPVAKKFKNEVKRLQLKMTIAKTSTTTTTATTATTTTTTTTAAPKTPATIAKPKLSELRTKPLQEVCWFEVIVSEQTCDGKKLSGTVAKWVREKYEGIKISKVFNGESYTGTVSYAWGNQKTGEVLFRIKYEDGDLEDIGWKEMEQLRTVGILQ